MSDPAMIASTAMQFGQCVDDVPKPHCLHAREAYNVKRLNFQHNGIFFPERGGLELFAKPTAFRHQFDIVPRSARAGYGATSRLRCSPN